MRRNLIAVTLFLTCFIFAGQAFGQEVTLTSKTRSTYLGSNGGKFAGPIQATDIYIEWENGIYIDVWAATSFNTKKDYGKEANFTFGKLYKFGKYNCLAEVTYVAAVDTDVININAELSRDHEVRGTTVSPFVRGEYYFPTHKGGPRRGVMGVAGIKTTTNLAQGIDFSLKAQLRKDSGNFGFNSALLGQARADVSFTVTKQINILGGLNFSTPLSHVTDGRKALHSWEFGVAYKLK